VFVSRESLYVLGYQKESYWEKHQQKFNGRANELADQCQVLRDENTKLADQCQVLRDENTKLLAENARLRRRLG
jgi:cell division protein FtsB